jgi:hypothetical protein
LLWPRKHAAKQKGMESSNILKQRAILDKEDKKNPGADATGFSNYNFCLME